MTWAIFRLKRVLSTETQQFFQNSNCTANSSLGASGAFVGTHILAESNSIIRGPTVCVAGFCSLFGPSTAHFILTDYSIPKIMLSLHAKSFPFDVFLCFSQNLPLPADGRDLCTLMGIDHTRVSGGIVISTIPHALLQRFMRAKYDKNGKFSVHPDGISSA